MLAWHVRIGHRLEVGVRIISVTGDQSVRDPADERGLVDAQACGCLSHGQHAALTQTIITRAQSVRVDEIGDPHGGEALVAAARARRTARTQSLFIQNVRDLSIDMMVEQSVDTGDDCERSRHLLCRGLGVYRCERLCLAPFEADVDRRRAGGGELEQRGIFVSFRCTSLLFVFLILSVNELATHGVSVLHWRGLSVVR